MAVLVSAVEVGSVRSLIPVLTVLAETHKLIIEKNFFFNKEIPKNLRKCLVDIPIQKNSLVEFILKQDIRVLLFSVNVKNTSPLKIARVVNSLNLPTIHLLDYWNGYRSRMELDGKKLFNPTKYLVIDKYSKQEAEKCGIKPNIIKVVGQPAFSDLGAQYILESQKKDPFKKIKNIGQNIILFVLEPVEDDQGSSLKDNKNFRGYTEKDVIKILICALKSAESNCKIILIPHPRQNLTKLIKHWRINGGEKYGSVLDFQRGKDILPFVDGVIGMASTLLYEAWLVGKHVLSIQPNLRNDSLRFLSNKKRVTFIDQSVNSENIIIKWLSDISDKKDLPFNDELKLHRNSIKSVVDEVLLFHN